MNSIKRYGVFLAGLFVASLGVALSTKAGLGTSPVASLPYSVSLVNHALSFGWWLNVLSAIQILVQIALLRRQCKPVEMLVQAAAALAYGVLTDFSCRLLGGVNPASYAARFGLMLAGCVVLALGIWLQLRGGVAMLPGEAMNRAVSMKTGRRFENVKVFFDVLYIAMAMAVSLLFTGTPGGVREGSVIAALLIGNIIKGYNRAYDGYRNRRTRNGDAPVD